MAEVSFEMRGGEPPKIAGFSLGGARRVSISAVPRQPMVVEVELLVLGESFAGGPARVYLDSDTENALVAMGWTPPNTEGR